MKKKIITSAIVVLCSTLTFVGCNASPSRQGTFDKNEYILSIDDDFDFLKHLTMKGGQKDEVQLISTANDIIEKTAEGVFNAKKSGSTIVEARINGKTIASCKVVVKYKLACPQNLKFSQETGTLKWDKSFVTINGENVFADKYEIYCKENLRPEQVGVSNQFDERVTLNSNEYSFSNHGSYTVSIKALSSSNENTDFSKYVDASDFCQEFIVNYGLMGEVENFAVVPNEDVNKENLTFVWKEKENALYDVLLQGFTVATNLTQARFELDYSSSGMPINEGQTIEVAIIAKDKDGFSQDTQTIKNIKRLTKPTLSYVNDDASKSSGHISLQKANADDECVYIIKDKDGKYISSETNLSNILDGYNAGIYKIQAYAKGGDNQINSAPTQIESFVKLKSPVVDMDIIDNSAVLSFVGDSYVKRYLLQCGDYSEIITLEDENNSYTLNLESLNLSAGDYSLNVVALPTLTENQISEYSFGGEKTRNVISSKPTTCNFTVLEDFSQISHYIENDINKFKFDHIEDATDYIIEMNGQVLSENKYAIDTTGDRVILSVPNLNRYQPVSNEYVLKITAIKKEGDKTTAVKSQATKTLKILDVVSEGDVQSDGSFVFTKVDGTDTYYYEIYQTGKDYTLPNGVEPLHVGRIFSGNKISETLSGGYYKIRIYSRANENNENEYLSADFVDSGRYFEKDFSISQKIETPLISYDKVTNSLTIPRVQFGGGYEIYVDGILNGKLDLADNGTIATYSFPAQTFKDAKRYAVTVKAVGGTQYGDEIYEDSNFASLGVTKLSLPTFTLREGFDEFGKKTNETLTIARETNAKAVEYFLDGEKLGDNGYSIELFDVEMGNSFKIGIKYIAKDESLDEYYIDSEVREKTFERITAPSNMEYSDGEITFVGSAQASDYYATLYLVAENGTTMYKGLPLGSTQTTIDLQAKLNLMTSIYPAFATALESADHYEVELYAQKNAPQGDNDNYLISSFNGTVISGGQSLVIQKLSASELSFDKQTKTLSWLQVEDGSTYDLYANGNPVLIGLTSLSINLEDSALSSLNLLNGVTFKVKSSNNKYLGSKFSNEIFVKKLSSIQEISVSTDGKVTILISDNANTSKILNNSVEMNYTAKDRSVTLSLGGNEDFNLTLIGIDNGNKYYLNSDNASFSLKQFAKPVISKDGNILSWQDLTEGQTGLSEDKLVYTLNVTNGTNVLQYNLTNNSINITELQSRLNVKLTDGQTKITVKVSLSGGYSLSANGLGYYGENLSEEITITKLVPVVGESKIVYGSAENAFAQKNDSKVEIEFADNWSSFDNVKFKINNTILSNGQYESTQQSQVVLGNGDSTIYMNLVKNSGKYLLTIDQAYFATAGKYNLEFSVLGDGYVESDVARVEVLRLFKVSSLEMSRSGKITFSDNNNFSGVSSALGGDLKYLVMLTIGGQKEVKQVERNSTLNADEFTIWENSYGSYTLQAICFDNNNQIIPSAQIVTIDGTKLEGIESLTVEEDGNLLAVISEIGDVEFTARIDGVVKTLNLTRKEDTNEFRISLLDVAEKFNLSVEATYTIEMTVRKIGSVDADWVSATFSVGTQDKYYLVKSEDGVKTYLVVEKKDDNSKKFRLSLGEQTMVISTAGIPFVLPILQGYVNYNLENEIMSDMLFSQSKGTNYFLCYAIELDACLNLTGIDYGNFNFDISRISKENGHIKQNNEEKIKVVKLNPIETQNTETDYLKVEDSILHFGFTNKTSKKNGVVSYLVDFAYNDGANHLEKFITTKSLDLRTVGLTMGIEYTISVRVLGEDNDVISSNSAGQLKTVKYTTPLTLEVNKGVLKFNESQFKASILGQKVLSYASGQMTGEEFVDFLENTTFTSPYYFNIGTDNVKLSNGKGHLNFVKLNGESVTGEEYYVSVSLQDLIPDFEISNVSLGEGVEKTFFGVMKYLCECTDITKSNDVTTFLNGIIKSNKGIGLNKILFDDIGREIPAGKYRVTINHEAGKSGNVDSAVSSICLVDINPAPAIDLVYDEEMNCYKANIAPQGEATSYKLQIRQNLIQGQKIYPLIYISLNDAGAWIAKCQGEDISDVILCDYSSGFGIKLNNIKKVLELKAIATLPTEQELICDIFQNDENALSKSGKFMLCYRELKGENIKFVDGKLELGQNHALTSEVLLRYQQKGLKEEQKIFSGAVNLPAVGEYDYFIISFPGKIIENEVYIESDRYMIKNAYKLDKPIVDIVDNLFNIKLSSGDINSSSEMTLSITNNKAGGHFKKIGDLNEITNLSSSGISYQTGGFVGELNADTYTFAFIGNSATLESPVALTGTDAQKAEYILNHSEKSVLVFSSAEQTSFAKMLPSVELNVAEGDLVWSECVAQTDGTIIYEVRIEYYSTSSSDTDPTAKKRQVLYTRQNNLSTNVFEDTLEAFDYTNYKISITPLVGQQVPSTQSGRIETIDGEFYTIKNQSFFGDGRAVLRGVSMGEDLSFKRATRATDAKVDKNGNIVFTLKESGFYIVAQRDGKSFRLNGTQVIDSELEKLTFTPYTGEDINGLEEDYKYTLTVYTYNLGVEERQKTLLSKPCELSQPVYKLPEITEDRFEIQYQKKGNNGYSTILDLTKYFTNNIAGNSTCYELVYDDGKSESIQKLTQKNKSLVLDGLTSIEMVAKAINETSLYLVNSTTIKFNVASTSIHNADNCQLSPYFDPDAQRFNWKWLDNRDGDYEFYVEIMYDDNTTTEVATVRNMYYSPIGMGTIKTFKISARHLDERSVQGITKYTFSKIYSIEGSFKLDKFQDGNGTSSKPYVISTKEQFLNISSRNDGGKIVYFKLADNLELNMSDLSSNGEFKINQFNGVLDGNGKVITLVCDQELKITSLSLKVGASATSYSFDKACALFESIASAGAVKNLSIKTSLKFGTAPQNCVISPIAVVNNGEISDVKVQSLTADESNVVISANTMFIGGLVGVNRGKIFQCQNVAQLNLQVKQTSFAYAGIALINEKEITKCSVTENKNFNLESKSSNLHLAGVALTNLQNGQISLCGVDSNFALAMTNNSNVYGGGIVENQILGTINACYFNGGFNKTSSASIGTLSIGGIIYSISGGSISNCVCTNTSLKFDGNGISSSLKIDNCYGSSNSRSLIALAVKDNILSSSSFKGITLSIQATTGNKFVAKLTY